MIKKLAESLSPITKKLEEVNQFTQKLDKVIKEKNSENENTQNIIPVEIESDNSEDDIKCNTKALPNISKPSLSMRKMIGSLMNGGNSLKITQNESGRANRFGNPLQVLGAATKK